VRYEFFSRLSKASPCNDCDDIWDFGHITNFSSYSLETPHNSTPRQNFKIWLVTFFARVTSCLFARLQLSSFKTEGGVWGDWWTILFPIIPYMCRQDSNKVIFLNFKLLNLYQFSFYLFIMINTKDWGALICKSIVAWEWKIIWCRNVNWLERTSKVNVSGFCTFIIVLITCIILLYSFEWVVSIWSNKLFTDQLSSIIIRVIKKKRKSYTIEVYFIQFKITNLLSFLSS